MESKKNKAENDFKNNNEGNSFGIGNATVFRRQSQVQYFIPQSPDKRKSFHQKTPASCGSFFNSHLP